MGSQPTKKFSPFCQNEQQSNSTAMAVEPTMVKVVAAVTSSPCGYDSAYDSLYSAYTSSRNTISSSNTSSPSSTRTSDTFCMSRLNSVPLMHPLTLNTMNDLPENHSISSSSRNLSRVRLEPLQVKQSSQEKSSSPLSSENEEKQINKLSRKVCIGENFSTQRTISSSGSDHDRLKCHRRSYPMSLNQKNDLRIDLLPPMISHKITTSSSSSSSISPTSSESSSPPTACKTLPLKEYKKWLINFRSKSQENHVKHLNSEIIPIDKLNQINDKLFHPKVRCETATLRSRRESQPSNNQIINQSMNKCQSNEKIFTISDKSFLNSSKTDNLLDKIQQQQQQFSPCNKKSNKNKLNKQQSRKLSIATMNCYNSDLIDGGSNTVFDLNALNDALTKPRNKVAPAPVSLLSVNHLKSSGNIF